MRCNEINVYYSTSGIFLNGNGVSPVKYIALKNMIDICDEWTAAALIWIHTANIFFYQTLLLHYHYKCQDGKKEK